MFEIKIEDQAVMSALGRLAQAGRDMSPVMRKIETEMFVQTEANFAAEGRPKWLGLKNPSERRKGGQILQDTGQLAASISSSSDATSATVGSNKVYAAIHQLGGKAGRGHKATIPARPFLPVDAQGNLQPEAEDLILGIANNYLAKLIGGFNSEVQLL